MRVNTLHAMNLHLYNVKMYIKGLPGRAARREGRDRCVVAMRQTVGFRCSSISAKADAA
jgi:hypothetical protein